MSNGVSGANSQRLRAAASSSTAKPGAGASKAPTGTAAPPKSKPEFEPNEAFADLDQTMAQAVASMQACLTAAPAQFNGRLTDDQLRELVGGTLGGKPLPAKLADLKNVARLLSSPDGRFFKAQLGAPIDLQALETARTIGFAGAHQEILKARLGSYASALAGPLQVFTDPKTKALKLDQLHLLLSDGVIKGKQLNSLVPDPAARAALLDAVAMLTDNRRLFAVVGTMNAAQLNALVDGSAVQVNDGTCNWTATLADVTRTTLPAQPGLEPTVDVRDPRWTKEKTALLIKEYAAFIDNRKMVPFHEAWHGENGSGGTKGPGSGEWFLQFHAAMGGDFIEWLKVRGTSERALVEGKLPNWGDMTKDLPPAFVSEGQNKNIGWSVPAFLSRALPNSSVTPFKLGRQSIRSLNDIKTMDDLGRVLGESGAHAVAHVQMGGAMATFKSVAEPAFMLWHYGAIEKIRHEWLKTENGKRWLAANPLGWSRPFLDPHDEVMHDVVERVLQQASIFGAPRGMGQMSPAQRLRDARQVAEQLCVKRSTPDKVIFTPDQILEAAVGFSDKPQKEAGRMRTIKVRQAAGPG